MKRLIEYKQKLDRHLEAKQKFNDYDKDIILNSSYFPDSTINLINETKREINNAETQFRSKLAMLLAKIRSGEKQINEFEVLLNEFQNSGWCENGIQRFSNENHKKLNQMKKVHDFKSISAIYLRNTENLEILIQQNKSKEIYIMLLSEELIDLNKDLYQKHFDCFKSLLRKKSVSIEKNETIFGFMIIVFIQMPFYVLRKK